MIDRRSLGRPLIPLAGVVLLAACGSGSGATAAGGSSATSTATGTRVTATETEWSITLSTKSFAPGTYTFAIDNTGKFAHNLTVAGPGISQQASPTVQGGSTSSLTVTLQKGTYELWCSVDSHKDKGMDLKITVA
jgi:plastocyanin